MAKCSASAASARPARLVHTRVHTSRRCQRDHGALAGARAAQGRQHPAARSRKPSLRAERKVSLVKGEAVLGVPGPPAAVRGARCSANSEAKPHWSERPGRAAATQPSHSPGASALPCWRRARRTPRIVQEAARFHGTFRPYNVSSQNRTDIENRND